jgi:endonuclease-3 related protein
VFVIDAYTKRILSRHGIIGHNEPYSDFQELFHVSLKKDARLYNEYHALFVATGKSFCRPRPLCAGCPLSVSKRVMVPLTMSGKASRGNRKALRVV